MPDANKSSNITERTWLPLSVISVIIAAVSTVSVYAGAIVEDVNSNKAAIMELKEKRFGVDLRLFDQVNKVREEVGKNAERTARVEGKLDVLLEKRARESIK